MNASVKSPPTISCIIIFLDACDYLSASIESVIAQTTDQWELMLVDDGSTDGSTEIAQRYAALHPARIKYLEHDDHENRGKNASRNLGIRRSSGEFIALLDADDVWLPDKLAEQLELMNGMPEAGMIYGRTQIWSSWSDGQGGDVRDSFFDLGVRPDTLVHPPHLFIQMLEGWAQTPTTCNAMIRRSVIDQIGAFDESFHDIFEDQAFFAKVELAFPVYVSGQIWARYRQHPESSFQQYSRNTSQDRSVHYQALSGFLDWLERYLQDLNDPDPTALAFLHARQRVVERKLRWISKPAWGALMISWLQFLEWALGTATKWGKRLLPVAVRDWLWVKIGKKIYMNL